jgi:hypothetical protein
VWTYTRWKVRPQSEREYPDWEMFYKGLIPAMRKDGRIARKLGTQKKTRILRAVSLFFLRR